MTTRMEHQHLDDGTLQQLVDGERPADGVDVESALAGCADCRNRLAARRARGESLSALLAATRPAPLDELAAMRTRRAIEARAARPSLAALAGRTSVRVAAGIVLVAGLAMASPVRSWLASRLGGAPATLAPAKPGSAPISSTPRTVTRTVVSFEAEGSELVIQLATSQREGMLEIRGDTGSRTAASVIGGDESLVVLPSELRIRNAAGSRSGYLVTVGANVRRVLLRVADDAAAERVFAVRPGGVERVKLGR